MLNSSLKAFLKNVASELAHPIKDVDHASKLFLEDDMNKVDGSTYKGKAIKAFYEFNIIGLKTIFYPIMAAYSPIRASFVLANKAFERSISPLARWELRRDTFGKNPSENILTQQNIWLAAQARKSKIPGPTNG